MKASIGAVITIGTFILSCEWDEYHAMLEFMVSDSVLISQMPHVLEECKPHILSQFPWMQEIAGESIQKMLKDFISSGGGSMADFWKHPEYGGGLIAKYGEFHEVASIPHNDHEQESIFEHSAWLTAHGANVITISD